MRWFVLAAAFCFLAGDLVQARLANNFAWPLSVSNTDWALWQAVMVASGGSSSNGGFALVKYQTSPTYDLDGNLTFDGVWAYRWDAENRLIEVAMTNIANVPNPERKKLEFGYDYQGRRVKKVVSTWNGSAFSNPTTNWFIYDEWNLVAIVDSQSSILQSFVWGQDLSGTVDGAGGIGGLLAVHSTLNSQLSTYDHETTPPIHRSGCPGSWLAGFRFCQ